MLAAYSPDRLSLVIVGCMGVIALASGFYCLAPVISFTNGLRNGQNSIKRAMNAEGGTAWMMALQMDRFFEQKTLDQLFQEYREKVRQQRENGLLISDIDDTVNEDILGLYSWQSVAAQIPGTMTGLGILGTFLGLLMGLRGINFMTVEAALGSVETILAGINTAFYTSIAGLILSVFFNVVNNICEQVSGGNSSIIGVMIESNLVEGNQKIEPDKPLVYGQSVTDACLGWDDTVVLLNNLAHAVRDRRSRLQ